jgi:hydroxymethylglutaryl-CoA lyase
VDPRRVPQMADADAVAKGIRRKPGVIYSGVWLNPQGFECAKKLPLDLVGTIFTSASETFSRRNSNRDREQTLADQRAMLAAYTRSDIPLKCGYVFTAFGCNYEGDVPTDKVVSAVEDLFKVSADAGVKLPLIYLCDTVGWGNPALVERTITAVRNRWPDLRIALHLHDTRGMGLANALVGLNLGVAQFDASCGGLGGCPFAGNKAASGNICTEDLVLMCEELGIATDVDLEAMIDCAQMAERIVGHPLPGRTMKAGSIAAVRTKDRRAKQQLQ